MNQKTKTSEKLPDNVGIFKYRIFYIKLDEKDLPFQTSEVVSRDDMETRREQLLQDPKVVSLDHVEYVTN